MKVLFLSLAFPKVETSKYVYTDLATRIHAEGDDLTVVAPAYNEEITGMRVEQGIKVLRVPTLQLFKTGILQKGLANVLLPYQYKRAINKHIKTFDFDVIITPTPPISLYKTVKWVKKKSRAKVYLILRDIFPQNAVDLGMMKKGSAIHSYFTKLERKLYRISDAIGCMSQGNIDFVLKHNPEFKKHKDRFHLLPNWGDVLPRMSDDDVANLREEHGFAGKFIVIFGGNIGKPQKLENIVRLAATLTDYDAIKFVIFGNGSEKPSLEKYVSENSLPNLELRDGISHSEYFKMVQLADLGLISLSEDFTIPNIPSKILSYYNAKKPVLASIDKNTDFGSLLESTNTGVWAEATDTKKLKELLLYLYEHPEIRKEMGENGYEHMKNELSSKKIYDIIIKSLT